MNLTQLALRNSAVAFDIAHHRLSRSHKKIILMVYDGSIFCLAIHLSLWLRFEGLEIPNYGQYVGLIFALIAIKSLFFKWMNLYRVILTYTRHEFMFSVLKAVVCSSSALVFLMFFMGARQLPRSVLLLDAALTLILIVIGRIFLLKLARYLHAFVQRKKRQKRVIIYGVGEAGLQVAQSLKNDMDYDVIGFSDDNPSLHHLLMLGLPIYPPQDLAKLLQKLSVDIILLALPEVSGARRKAIVQTLKPLGIPIYTIPSISEIISGRISVNTLRPLDINDLLGREQVQPCHQLFGKDITGKSVLVTGAGGSIGSELCRQILRHNPKSLVLYELNEFALYSIDIELAETYPQIPRFPYLGSVTDPSCLGGAIAQHDVETIYHAAAYKHVPMVERNVAQGIINNVFGTLNAVTCANKLGVKKFVLISTDKAVRPTNVMGATKRVTELILQAYSSLPDTQTCLTMVRFGNVLNSSGSVVPRFQKQIKEGKPITLTHPDITRYFMSIPEASSLVIQAGAMSRGGEVFLLEMGEPVRIYDLAVQMIELSGLIPHQDIEIQITGLRPGEKIYEELLIDCSKATPTQHPKIFCARESGLSWPVLEPQLLNLFTQARLNDRAGIVECLKRIVPEYQVPQHQYQVSQNQQIAKSRSLL
ncbi:MAG: polysaccharide biosynthesis protein [Limnospira sp.]